MENQNDHHNVSNNQPSAPETSHESAPMQPSPAPEQPAPMQEPMPDHHPMGDGGHKKGMGKMLTVVVVIVVVLAVIYFLV